ncbi:MAG: hypothetical protein NC548_05825 [Lachnospiraceae bacterium]|nr:hypothetical protein [Lachnospiraceae bacterium]
MNIPETDLKSLAQYKAEHPDVEHVDGYVPPAPPAGETRELTPEEAAAMMLNQSAPTPQSTAPVADDEDDAPVLITSKPSGSVAAEPVPQPTTTASAMPTPVPVAPSGVNMDAGPVSLTAAEIAELAPNLPEDERLKKYTELNAKKAQYVRDLIMQGFTPSDAEKAAMANIRREMQGADEAYVKENPTTGVVTIDKTAGQTKEDLKLTEEEHQKLVRVKAIKLVEVSTLDLSSVEVEAVEPSHKIDFIRTMDCGLSKYSTPLPVLGDYVTFRGAQLIQLMRAVNYEDAKIEEILNAKASLIYEKLMSGSILQKFDEDGKRKMTYTEFINRFPYPDLDVGLFGILCASSPEVQTGTFTCTKCKLDYEAQYNIKTIIDADKLTDEAKGRYEDILTHKNDAEYLRRLYEVTKVAHAYKSPFTENIYSLSVPSVGRAIDVMKKIDQSDAVMMYNAALAIYMNSSLIKNNATGKYVKVDENEPNVIIDLVMTLPDEDVRMLLQQISTKYTYNPTFTIRTKCKHCGHEDTFTADITQMVFRKAQDSYTEIQ